jgi:hypothetical protein
MTVGWQVVIAVSTVTVLIKAAGPVLLAGKTAGESAVRNLDRFAPAVFAGVLAALIVTQVFARREHIVFDERVGGLVVAMLGAHRRAPPVLVILAAVVVAALMRQAILF